MRSKKRPRGIDRFLRLNSSIIERSTSLDPALFEDVGRDLIRRISGKPGLPRPEPRVPMSPTIRRLQKGFFEILESQNHNRNFEIYFHAFYIPFRKVSRSAYLEFVIAAYLNEIYLLRGRLLSYLDYAQKICRNNIPEMNLKTRIGKLRKGVYGTFDGAALLRGKHVHEKRYSDGMLKRIQDIEFCTHIPKLGFIRTFLPSEAESIRAQWHRACIKNNREIAKFLNEYFDALFPLVFARDLPWTAHPYIDQKVLA